MNVQVRTCAGFLAPYTVRMHLRAELIDRMLIFSQRHLRVVLSEYVRHCNGRRPYRARALRDRPTLSWTSAVDTSSVDRLWVA
jgi:hypothetical protein